jgi:hypothetical protein
VSDSQFTPCRLSNLSSGGLLAIAILLVVTGCGGATQKPDEPAPHPQASRPLSPPGPPSLSPPELPAGAEPPWGPDTPSSAPEPPLSGADPCDGGEIPKAGSRPIGHGSGSGSPPRSGGSTESGSPRTGDPDDMVGTGSPIPSFPWPPPEASARILLPQELIEDGHRFQTLADANSALMTSLRETGYVESGYYAIPGGFALVTKIERIERDGTPRVRDRFSFSFTPASSGPVSFRDYLRALFTANPGRYRILVFAVTDIPFAEGSRSVTPEEAEQWIPHGTQAIPQEIGQRAWTAQFSCTALIYEFIHEQQQAPRIVLPGHGALSALAHLQGAQLWKARLAAVFKLSR